MGWIRFFRRSSKEEWGSSISFILLLLLLFKQNYFAGADRLFKMME